MTNDANGSPRIVLYEPTGSTAEVCFDIVDFEFVFAVSVPVFDLRMLELNVLLHGGQVISWKNERREEMLFMTNKAVLKPNKAIRGGIPICFPQFANFGSLEQHGFARNKLWSLDNDPSPLPPANSQSTVDLILRSTEEDLKTWAHRFELRIRISVSASKLTLIPRVRNIDNKSFSFMFALRNYFSVSDVSEVRVEGLETLDYFDNLIQRERYTEQADAITFDGESIEMEPNTQWSTVNYFYDHEKKRTFVLRKEGMPDAAVWNPWDKKAKALPDLGDEEYTTMLCVDSAAIETALILKPCEEWKGRQELSTVSSSYCSGQLDPRKKA
ncbi:hypothetical protein RJ639_036286 [Escallonia herrerae]|uniref:glucose-6-phosphate 1-epimerase n=1 Tax=Escallonia herrerae TaxID=1293975 RepID=A0AA89BCI8_9ASTE|nr:hypothetical protein RJ639_036286 [Escallonia herrerae]